MFACCIALLFKQYVHQYFVLIYHMIHIILSFSVTITVIKQIAFRLK